MLLQHARIIPVTAGEEVPVLAHDPHPPPVIGHDRLLHRGLGVQPGEELERVPVLWARLKEYNLMTWIFLLIDSYLPVSIRPQNFWFILRDQFHQLRAHLVHNKASGRQIV